MRQLRLVGLAEDGGSLLLESPTGESYRLALDERLRAACRGDLTRLGQIEIEMDNPLRPAEIQARVRSGESAEQVAAASGMPLDRVLRFAYPVLQERARVVAQARSTPVRPKAAEQLGGLVEQRLVGRGTDAATLEWDAWRRDDGRWAVRLSWRHGERAHAAHWSLDIGRRELQTDDPAAEQLSAEEFHARTITAVTPLAVAARAADESPSRDARPAGAPGRSAASDRPRTHPAGSAREPAAGSRSNRRPSADRAPGMGSGAEPPATERQASERPVAERPVAERPVAERPVAERPVAERPVAERPVAERPATGATGAGGGAGARRGAVERRRGSGERRPRAASDGDPDEDGDPAEQGRIASGGGTVPLVDADGEDDRSRRATVPSWDDILLGVRRRY
jgi:hypothetical protein